MASVSLLKYYSINLRKSGPSSGEIRASELPPWAQYRSVQSFLQGPDPINFQIYKINTPSPMLSEIPFKLIRCFAII